MQRPDLEMEKIVQYDFYLTFRDIGKSLKITIYYLKKEM